MCQKLIKCKRLGRGDKIRKEEKDEKFAGELFSYKTL
jgi:hypothetical protein